MNLRDFRIGWRLLVKEPAYSAVVILGLTVGFAVCFLLLGYVRHSFSYDQNVPEVDSVYRLNQRWNTPGSMGSWTDRASLPARDAVLAAGVPLLASPFIERKVDMKVGASVQTVSISAVDPDFQKMFKLKVLAGDIDAALTRPDALALARETAIRLFSTADAAGKTVQIDGQPYLVAAVVADQPSTSTLPFASLTGTGTRIWDEEYRKLVTTNWGSSHGPVYVKLLPGASAAPVADSVKRTLLTSAFYKRMTPDQLTTMGGRDPIEFKLGPLREAYLDPEVRTNALTAPHGDRAAILGLAAVAVLILLL
ncbi:MAG: ABC transporter permease, partial [Massilia sp.]|nr:ABC transporter permease [Massilia sp.]